MPELPDIIVYAEHVRARMVGRLVEHARALSPFVLRTAVPPLDAIVKKRVVEVRTLGKRIVLGVEGSLFVVVHLMIAGRLRWLERKASPPRSGALLSIGTPEGSLLLTEAGTQRRASVHVVAGTEALASFDRGGLDIHASTDAELVAAMTRARHTLKRALTDPTILSGIGNAYSDEILHRACLSPLRRTDHLTAEDWTKLCDAIRTVLDEWTERLRRDSSSSFPRHVTAFRPGMAAHGRHGQPCPRCGDAIQRIVYASNETNYCARCQTDGKLLADRALSRLLREDWPRSLEELETRKRERGASPDGSSTSLRAAETTQPTGTTANGTTANGAPPSSPTEAKPRPRRRRSGRGNRSTRRS